MPILIDDVGDTGAVRRPAGRCAATGCTATGSAGRTAATGCTATGSAGRATTGAWSCGPAARRGATATAQAAVCAAAELTTGLGHGARDAGLLSTAGREEQQSDDQWPCLRAHVSSPVHDTTRPACPGIRPG